MAAASSQISIEEYLKTSTEPDCEYVDGVLEERAVGELDHSTWQVVLAGYFFAREKELGIFARTELRVQTRLSSFRVSPEDSMARIMKKLAEYEQMGIGAIWVIEPKTPQYWHYRKGQLAQESVFTLPGTGFAIPFAEIAALAD